MPNENKPQIRSEIEDRYKWNLDEIYPAREDWEKDYDKMDRELIPALESFQGKLKNAKAVLACLRKSDEVSRVVENLYVYAHMKADENQADHVMTELSSRSGTLASRAGTASAYISPELLALPEKTIRGFMKKTDFKDYVHTLDALLKKKPHTLSKAEEEILAGSSDMAGSAHDIYNKLRVADMKYPVIPDPEGKDVQLSPAIYSRIMEDRNRDFRKRAYEGMFQSYEKSKNTFAAALNGEVKKNIFYSKVRKYPSALEAALDGEFIPRTVYDNLLKAVNDRIGPLNRYIEIRRKVLKLDKVRLHDLYVPLVDDFEMKISYEEAKIMLIDGLSRLGTDYLTDFKKGLESRWVDVYETDNKNTGGYNWGTYDTHPYILMNYNDTFDSMLTLAHEMGHAMHAFYSHANQTYPNSGITIFTAEVASTANEILMLKYLISIAKSGKEKLFYLNHLVESIRGTVYSQVMYSEFEKAIHERVESGEALSVQSLSDIWSGVIRKYYGPSFEMDELASLGWSRIPHFYMNFYVYKYATSMAASYHIVRQIEGNNAADAQKKFLSFLKSGGSDYPIELLKAAGVDMASTEPVDGLLAEFNTLLDQMEELLG